jgi:hypothetical protein
MLYINRTVEFLTKKLKLSWNNQYQNKVIKRLIKFDEHVLEEE